MTEIHHSAEEASRPDLDLAAGVHADGLRKALDVAAPAPISWVYACEQFAAGRWLLITSDQSSALICHVGFAGHKSTSIIAMAGDLTDCSGLVLQIEKAADDAGSACVVFIGRRGWTRAFPEYAEKAVIGVKELK